MVTRVEFGGRRSGKTHALNRLRDAAIAKGDTVILPDSSGHICVVTPLGGRRA